MEVNGDDAAGAGAGAGAGAVAGTKGGNCEGQNPTPTPTPSNPKSCKGCLYYSAVRNFKSKDPTCVGISGTYDKFPPHILRAAELAASKRGSSHAGFVYGCLGYSIYFDDKSSSADSQNETPKLPFCFGLEIVGHRPESASESNGVCEQEHATPQPQCYKPPHATPQPRVYKRPHVPGEEYFNRFKRNASVVASGVARNFKRVGNYVKENLADILNPYRRGPK